RRTAIDRLAGRGAGDPTKPRRPPAPRERPGCRRSSRGRRSDGVQSDAERGRLGERRLFAPARRAEERRAAQGTVERRPRVLGGLLALEAIEAAHPGGEVVRVVDEDRLPRGRDDRAAVLDLAVVAEDDVPDRARGLLREPLEAVD